MQSLPVSTGSLGRQVHAVHAVVVVVHDLGQAKVSDLDLPTGRAVHQQNITCRAGDRRQKFNNNSLLFTVSRDL